METAPLALVAQEVQLDATERAIDTVILTSSAAAVAGRRVAA